MTGIKISDIGAGSASFSLVSQGDLCLIPGVSVSTVSLKEIDEAQLGAV